MYNYYIGSDKYIIPKTKCWPVFKQDPVSLFSLAQLFFQV